MFRCFFSYGPWWSRSSEAQYVIVKFRATSAQQLQSYIPGIHIPKGLISCDLFLSSLGCSRDGRDQVPWLQISWSHVAQSEGETLCKTCVLGFYHIKLPIGNKGSEIVNFQSSWSQNLCLLFFLLEPVHSVKCSELEFIYIEPPLILKWV